MEYIKKKKILLCGGGTGGSVTPLLAMAEVLKETRDLPTACLPDRQGQAGKKQEYEFLFVGTKNGPEKEMVGREGIKFISIPSGKWRRYFSWKNFTDLFLIKLGFFKSLYIILKHRPDIILTAGSFVSVPMAIAGWVCRVPVFVHQQDIRPGLANKIMAPFAKIITVTFQKSLRDYGAKAVWTGNPVRKSLKHVTCNMKHETNNTFPTIFIVGGGTGAEGINKLVTESVEELTKNFNVIHQAGKNKILNFQFSILNYKVFEFLTAKEMAEAYARADMIISRAGMGAVTEVCFVGKPAILIPMPDSHQEENAAVLSETRAALVLNQKTLVAVEFVKAINELWQDESKKEMFRKNLKNIMKPDANEKIAKLIKEILK